MKLNLKLVVSTLCLILPASGYAEPVTPANQPLFLSNAVKHNLILGVDDSGSMDFEVLFPVNDGALWLNSDGTFVNSDGTLVDGVGEKYTYLFPNGASSSYENGAAKLTDAHDAIPPIKAYAFARSAEYNRAYYDPGQDYDPWPSYGGFSFPEYSGSAAPYDPFKTSATFNLVSDFDTSTKTAAEWDFDIEDSDMVCDDSGNTCTETDKDYTYYPATYWVVDNTSTYTFDSTKVTKKSFYTTNSVLLEAENGTLLNGYEKASSNGPIYNAVLAKAASAEDYIGSTKGDVNDEPLSTYGEASWRFSVPSNGEYTIWIRKQSRGDTSDSLWANLEGVGQADLSVILPDNPFRTSTTGEDWIKWWRNLTLDSDWTWDPLASVTLAATDTHNLRIRAREVNLPIDQILITRVTSPAPSGVMTLTSPPASETRDCSVAGDLKPAHYDVFRHAPDAFDGVDALGPDGKCLRKVEIRSTTSTYPSGRTYEDELQNFSNWFTYYRRRHQAIRGGIGAAFQGIGGINAGLYWINNLRTVDMYDLDTASELKTFLDDNYKHVGNGGTKLRSALDHARTQFARTGTGAPITQECQQNFTLLFTDGFAESESITDIGNEDGSAGTPYEDTYSSTLADIAYKMYIDNPRTDLTPTGAVQTPTGCDQVPQPEGLDCNSNLHINTYTVGLGAQGTLFGVNYNSVADAYANQPIWPDTGTRDRRQIDDLYHAAVNGRGEIFNAQSPVELRTELSNALQTIIASLGSASGVTFNSATLESDSLIFSALFNSTSWSGDVQARALNPANGNIASSPSWSVAAQLANTLPGNREIITYSRSASSGVPFRWSSLDTGQVADLNTSPGGSADSLGQARLDYLRGSTAQEGQAFRNRDGLLGDIVNSTPLFVGPPRLNWPDAAPFGTSAYPYSAFRGDTSNVNRAPMVYVGSNDGMLHGFKAVESVSEGGGDELLAYVPRSLFSSDAKKGLHYLTDPDYTHRYYADLSPQAVDAYIKDTPSGTPAWRTVLFGGLRAGGAGLFALDITDPSTFSEANASDIVLWEFDETNAPELNYILEQPVAAMMNNDRWALLFGNGFNNGDGSNPADDKTGLFVLYLDGGLDGTWTAGTDYEFIEVGSTGGLGAITAIDTDGDRVTDRVYGGDLEGNLWAFDLSNTSTSKWESAFKDGSSASANAAPLFTANEDLDGDGVTTSQPIAMRPLVLRNTLSPVGEEGSNGEDYLIYFGSGKYFETGDPSNTSPQTMYGIWDRGDGELTRDALLQEQTITDAGDLRTVTENQIDWSGANGVREYGWFMDLPASGERVLNSPKFRGEVLFFETYTPATDPCSSGGSSYFMTVDLDGSQPPLATFDANNDGKIDSSDGIYAGQRIDGASIGNTGILGTYQYYQNEKGNPEKREVDFGDDANRAGRLGWHELSDF